MLSVYEKAFKEYLLQEGMYRDKLLETSVRMYMTKIKVFFEFLTNEYNLNNLNLRYIEEEKILHSISYYIETRRIKFNITAQNYFTVITKYFSFLQEIHGISNELFNSKDRHNNLKQKVDNLIESYELSNSKIKDFIDDERYELAIKECNKHINNIDVDMLIYEINNKKNHKLYYDFLSSITLKIILYLGLKNQILIEINRDKYDEKQSLITINNYTIHLPYVLNEQMKKYIEIRDYILKNKNNIDRTDKLFIRSDGKKFSNKEYQQVFKILGNIISSHEVESVSKYVICKMIEGGIDRKKIMELTGISFETYLHCEEFIYELSLEPLGNKIDIFKLESSQLDSKLRGLDSFIKL